MLDVQSLYVNYGNVEALKDISLSVQPGEILAVVGPNGAGKSTLIKAISGALPFRGQVLVDGKDFSRLGYKQRACLLAVVPQARPASRRVFGFANRTVGAHALYELAG